MEAKHKIRDVYPTTDKITLKNVKGTKIRIYPDQLYIPPECADLVEQNCEYPCVWNKDNEKCVGIPVSGYQPGATKKLKRMNNQPLTQCQLDAFCLTLRWVCILSLLGVVQQLVDMKLTTPHTVIFPTIEMISILLQQGDLFAGVYYPYNTLRHVSGSVE